MKINLEKIEGIGLLFVLFSFTWQLIEDETKGIAQENKNYQLNKKLDYLWLTYTADYGKRNPDADFHRATDVASLDKDWQIYSDTLKEEQNVENQINIFSWIRVILFIIGSVLIIIPKFLKKEL